MGSLIILFKIPTQFVVSPEKIHLGKIRVILVLCSDDISDVVAFDYLQARLFLH
jgi:serine/threonine protein phosphatase PrpC